MLQNKEHGTEALHRATLESPGHQKIHITRKWGFIKFNADEFENMVAEKQLIPDGCGVKYIPKIWPSGQVVGPLPIRALALAPPYSCPPINPTFFQKKMWHILQWNTAAAAAKSLQSCPTLCDPIDGSSPGSAIPGILQARTMEWVAISFSNA